jgi:pimeloyl-ACP methyl ester carboxylesterase
MQRSLLLMIIGLSIALPGLAGCGGGAKPEGHDIEYRAGRPLNAHVTAQSPEGSLRIEQITYTSVDGETVPARLAIPTDHKPLGCVMYQGGLGQTKEQFPELRRGLGQIRLATFTIDPRNTGARGSPQQALAAIKEPETLKAMVLDTVVDLRMGLDYLESRSECHRRIAYMGTSFGGAVGSVFAGEDPRIKAVVLTSLGPTYKAAIVVGGVASKQSGLPAQVPGAADDPAQLARAVRILSPYDPITWVSRIAPRPLMLVNGRFDPGVLPIDALQMADAAGDPKTIVYFNGGHNPFAAGPDEQAVTQRLAEFLVDGLNLPTAF